MQLPLLAICVLVCVGKAALTATFLSLVVLIVCWLDPDIVVLLVCYQLPEVCSLNESDHLLE